MKEKFAKLLDVKTIITLALVGATITLTFYGRIDPKEISSMTLMAISFFLGYKANKTT